MSAKNKRSGHLKTHAFRLKPHQDLKKEVQAWAKKKQIRAGCIITGVGSLERIHLRFAHQNDGTKRKGPFEIVSFVGTFSNTYAHLHLSVADSSGRTFGGHLFDDNLVFTTAEIIVAELPGTVFKREKDETYGYQELVIKPYPKKTRTKAHERTLASTQR
jgi:predicted DNA-binding protein with PD1-like motif